MKKMTVVMAFVATLMVLAFPMTSLAEEIYNNTFSPHTCMRVHGDRATGIVTVTGDQQDVNLLINYLLQYCSDGPNNIWRAMCPTSNKVQILESSPGYLKFQMHMKSANEFHKHAFNLKGGPIPGTIQWLQIPNPFVSVEGDLLLETSVKRPGQVQAAEGQPGKVEGDGGTMFVLVDKATYTSPYPFPDQGGQACNGEGKPMPVVGYAPPVKVAASPVPPAQIAVPAKKHVKHRDGSLCEDPCMQEVVANTRESVQLDRAIKDDTTKIKTDVKKVKHDVKHIKKYVRKTYKKVKVMDESLGRPKDGKTPLHKKVDENTESLKRIEEKLGTNTKKQSGGK